MFPNIGIISKNFPMASRPVTNTFIVPVTRLAPTLNIFLTKLSFFTLFAVLSKAAYCALIFPNILLYGCSIVALFEIAKLLFKIKKQT
jgi:hypothetical protein